jgi:hypothetical protein
MLQELTDDDIKRFKASERDVFKLQVIIFLPLAILIALLSGIFGFKSWGYWTTVLLTLTLLSISFTGYLVFQIISHRKDITQKQKRVETVKIVSKKIKDGKRILMTDNVSIKHIDIFHRNAFDMIKEGDILNVEETLKRRYLLRLERDGQNLLHAG